MLCEDILNGSLYEGHLKRKWFVLLLLWAMGLLDEALDMFACEFVGILHEG